MQLANRISSIPKSGIREIFDIASSQEGVINLGIGEPDFNTPKFIRDSAKKAIDRGCHNYTTNSGMLELRSEISKKLKKENGMDVDPRSEIIVTSGATQAIFVAMHCLLNPGDEVLMPSPVFVAYMQSVKIAGGTPVEVPMKEEENYALSVKSLEKAVTKRTKLLVLNSPCNPTGTVYSRNAMEEASAFAEIHGLTIVSDEIYEDFLYEDTRSYSPASKPEFRDRILTINGFSKTFAMTGWRLGYAAGPEKLISAMTRYNMYNQVCATTIAQIAGIAALRGSRSFFKPILKRYSNCRRTALELLDKLGLEFAMPQGAFYIFPNISKIATDSMAYAKRLLLEERVAVTPGSAFGRAGEGHIRLSYSQNEETLQKATKRISRFNERFGN